MADPPLIARFKKEIDEVSFSDPDLNLGYQDRQRLKNEDYVGIARDRLAVLEKQMRWIGVTAVTAGLLLAGVCLWYLVDLLWAGASGPGNDPFPVFYAACMGAGAIYGLWRTRRMERQRVVCELVIAEAEAEPQTAA